MKKRVLLIVEGNPKMQYQIVTDLKSKFSGKSIILTTSNGSQAMRLLNICPVDIIIADLEMNATSSLEFLQEIAGKKTILKTILMDKINGLPVKKLCIELNLNAHIPAYYSVDTVSDVLNVA